MGRRLPDLGIAFCCGAMLIYGWTLYLPHFSWLLLPVMILATISYLMLWVQPWLPSTDRSHV